MNSIEQVQALIESFYGSICSVCRQQKRVILMESFIGSLLKIQCFQCLIQSKIDKIYVGAIPFGGWQEIDVTSLIKEFSPDFIEMMIALQ